MLMACTLNPCDHKIRVGLEIAGADRERLLDSLIAVSGELHRLGRHAAEHVRIFLPQLHLLHEPVCQAEYETVAESVYLRLLEALVKGKLLILPDLLAHVPHGVVPMDYEREVCGNPVTGRRAYIGPFPQYRQPLGGIL